LNTCGYRSLFTIVTLQEARVQNWSTRNKGRRKKENSKIGTIENISPTRKSQDTEEKGSEKTVEEYKMDTIVIEQWVRIEQEKRGAREKREGNRKKRKRTKRSPIARRERRQGYRHFCLVLCIFCPLKTDHQKGS